MKRQTTLMALSLLTGATNLTAQQTEQKPNIVLILADDIGYGDLGCYGATLIQTPNIDKLASQGRRFTDAHSASAVSTPSRYGMLTGQYPFRGQIPGAETSGVWGPLALDTPLIIDTETLTLPGMLQKQGYATACLGKWHLGFSNETTNWNEPLTPGPNDVGFDYFFGIPLVNSGPPYVYVRNDRVVGLDPDDPIIFLERGSKVKPTATQKHPNKGANRYAGGQVAHDLYKDDEHGINLVDESLEWIKKNKENPFFLYLSTPHIHHPFTPAERFKGTSGCGIYGDFLHEFDWMVGEVMACLEEQGLADNTLVILTSDNGAMFNHAGQAAWAMGHRINGGLLGFKFDVWEGGHSVPLIARWDGHIEPGSMSDQLFSGIDLFSTFAQVAGYTLCEGEAPDSHNLLEVLVGDPQGDEMLRAPLILSSFSSKHMSIRWGDWVYIPEQGNGGWTNSNVGAHLFSGPAAMHYVGLENSDLEDGKIKEGAPAAQLYNLREDRKQTINVIEEYPEIAQKMQAELDKIWASEQTRNN